MGKLVRMISNDGTLTVMAADTADIVERARQIHGTSPVITAALGRLMTATGFMGAVMKGRNDSVTVRINGSGPSGTVMAVSDNEGNVRGYARNPIVELPLNSLGKLDVAGAVGTDGTLTVIKDMGLKEPYVGRIPIVSGEIAEDITSYYAISEQTPTVCSLGVLVDTDCSVKAAGGFIIQLLPTAMDDTIDKVEKCIKDIPPVTKLLSDGMTPEEICRFVLREFDLELLDGSEPGYVCNCSRERTEKLLISVGKEELSEMAKDPVTEVSCQFCNTAYRFTSGEINELISSM